MPRLYSVARLVAVVESVVSPSKDKHFVLFFALYQIINIVRHLPNYYYPSIAQLVKRRAVEAMTGILRSLVQIRLEGKRFCLHFYEAIPTILIT